MSLTNYPWNRVARTAALNGVQFGATRVHNDVRFHWGSIAASRDVAFSEKTTPVVTHRKGYTQTITDIASSTRLEAFAALAETRDALGAEFLQSNGVAFDRFARDLVVWAAPKIPGANKGKALQKCLDAKIDAATCSRAFGTVAAQPTKCVAHQRPVRAIRLLEMDTPLAAYSYSFSYDVSTAQPTSSPTPTPIIAVEVTSTVAGVTADAFQNTVFVDARSRRRCRGDYRRGRGHGHEFASRRRPRESPPDGRRRGDVRDRRARRDGRGAAMMM